LQAEKEIWKYHHCKEIQIHQTESTEGTQAGVLELIQDI
jgi:hypothetical protein